MAEERIDVVVDDKVDGNVEKKIRGIADASDKGFSAVQKLKSALADINVSSVTKLQQASASMTNALARELNAQARLTAARDKSAVADAKAATERQRLATETARTEAAQARAAAAATRAAQAQISLDAAQARAARSGGDLAARAERLKAALDPLYAAQARFNQELAEARTLLDAGAINMRTYVNAVGQAQARLTGATGAVNGINNSVKAGKVPIANIAAQVNDLGVQFAMAAQSGDPLKMVFMALIQQGSQLSYIASTMEGGWAGLSKTIGGMLLRFLPLIAAIGVFVGIFKTLQSEFNKASGNIDPFVKSLGLTKDELKELGDTSINTRDMLLGFFDTFMQMTGLNKITDDVASFFSKAWENSIWFIRMAFIGFYGLVVGGMRGIAETIMNLPTVAAATAKAIVNAAIAAVEWAVNKAIEGLNMLIDPVRSLLSSVGVEVGQFGRVTFGRFTMSAEDSANTLAAVMNRNVTGSIREADATLTAFTNNWRRNADLRRRERLTDRARQIREDRPDRAGPKGREDRTAERRAHALEMVNLQLDNELARMRLLKDERAVQQRMDQIAQQLAQKNITLTDTERTAIEGKVRAIEQYKYVQSEMDRIYEEVIAPQRTYNATIAAATDLLQRGAITQERFAQETVKAGRALAEATDPLFAMKEAMDAAEASSTLYGEALQQQNYYEQIRQQYLAKGIVLSQTYTAGLNAEVDALMRRNAALQQQQFIQSTISGIVDPILQDQRMLDSKAQLYAEIDRLRQQDVLNEQQAQQARYALDAQYSEMRLRGAQSFFSEMASLQSSGSKELAAIGKAAAVAQATIDGYVAVQKALASAPPPWNFAMAAAVAIKTGAQVAGILSTNVGSFATGGQFMVDGRSGVDANNINMNVTRGERVTIETPAQQRANDAAANGAGGASPVSLKVVNVTDPREALAALETSEGEQTFVNIIERNAPAIRRILG